MNELLGVHYILADITVCCECLTKEWFNGIHHLDGFGTDAILLYKESLYANNPEGILCSDCNAVIVPSICNDCGDRYDCKFKRPNGPGQHIYGRNRQKADNSRLGIKCSFNSNRKGDK
jgi:hypothetical protein